MHSQLFDDLEYVHFLAKLFSTALEQEILSLPPRFAAEAVGVIKVLHSTEPAVLVSEGLARLYLSAHLINLCLVSETCTVFLHLVE